MTRQTIGDVTVTVRSEDNYLVKAGSDRARTFRGESAWSNAERYANDKLTELYGWPTPGIFTL
jgi:hypothetical protein